MVWQKKLSEIMDKWKIKTPKNPNHFEDAFLEILTLLDDLATRGEADRQHRNKLARDRRAKKRKA